MNDNVSPNYCAALFEIDLIVCTKTRFVDTLQYPWLQFVRNSEYISLIGTQICLYNYTDLHEMLTHIFEYLPKFDYVISFSLLAVWIYHICNVLLYDCILFPVLTLTCIICCKLYIHCHYWTVLPYLKHEMQFCIILQHNHISQNTS